MKTLFSPIPSFSPQSKPSHAPSARQGTLVTDPQLVNEIYKGMQNHPFKPGVFEARLIEESPEVCETIAKRLGLNTENFKVRTFQVDSFDTFAQKYWDYYEKKHRKGTVDEASINALSFITPTGSEKKPVALHIGQLLQKFEADGYRNVPGDSFLLSGLGDYGYLSDNYKKTIVPLVGEKIDNSPSVIGSIQGAYEVIENKAFPKGQNHIKNPYSNSHKRVYKGLGTPKTLDAFFKKNPTMFSDESTIRKWYG
jgi:hypothetical protein